MKMKRAKEPLSAENKKKLLDAADRARERVSKRNRRLAVSSSRLVRWQRKPSFESGLWWWWNGDKDCAPIPLNIAYSGHSDSYFVMSGQYGMTMAEDATDREGWWMRCFEPELPSNAGAERRRGE